MGVESGRGHVPPIKISGGTSPPKIPMKISKSDYFYGSKLDPYRFHHNLSIVVAILDRTKPSHILVGPINTHVLPLIRPEETAEMRPPPIQKCVATPLLP